MTQNRRSRRSHVLMAAQLLTGDDKFAVKLRNLSEHGALIEAACLPEVGTLVRFRKGDLNLTGEVAWVDGSKAGIAFDTPLDTDSVLRHVPVPKAAAKLDFRRPPVKRHVLSEGERKVAERWIFGRPAPTVTD